MEEPKETARKRPLEPSLLACNRNREDRAEAKYLDPVPKRLCTGRDGDSFEEFFALLQRIEATQRYSFRTRNQLNGQDSVAKCAQGIKTPASKASWRPSFEWEDFSSRRNGTRDVVVSSDGQALDQKGIVRPAKNNLKQPSPETSPNPALKGLDLNNLPEELPLFQ